MARVPQRLAYGFALICALSLALALMRQADAQSADRCFAETPFCIAGPFRALWERGALAVFGFPLSAQRQPVGADSPAAEGAAQLQWFERHRIESHPTNPAPYALLLGRVGAERLEQLGRDWRAQPGSAPRTGCRYVPETERNICPPFLAVWLASGLELDGRRGVSAAESVALFGLPLTEPQEETIDGQTYLVQWFERARFELHIAPDGTQRVLLGRLGAELLASGGAPPEIQPATPTAGAAPTTGAAPTATRTATRRPTRQPTDVPAPTQATSTALPATRTPIPPTATPVDPFLPPAPPALPPGFNDTGGLPGQALGPRDFDTLGALNAGSLTCISLTATDPVTDELTIQIASDTAEIERFTVELDAPRSFFTWRWTPGLSYTPGTYTMSAVLSPTLTVSSTFTVQGRAPGAGPNLTMVRTDTLFAEQDFIVGICGGGLPAPRGTSLGLIMTGFQPNEQVDLYLYGPGGCAAGQVCFQGLLRTVTVDAQGQAFVPIPTLPTYPIGSYLVLTADQAAAPLGGSSGSDFEADWWQGFRLR